uniref:Ig-like domain-containing protein n=1 Tax=Kryptolebias marmoratus TaxID=37003 RepID=A0A3Q3FBF5_KRYMA
MDTRVVVPLFKKGDRRVFSIKPSVILKPDWTQIFRGETVTLSCQIQRGGGTQLAFKWRPTNRNPPTSSEYRINKVTESHSGEYSCQGVRGFQQTGWSDVVRLTVLFSKPSVILKPNWTQIFRGETVTLSCQIQGGGGSQWMYEWRPTNRNPPTSSEYRINGVTESHREYSCRGKNDSFSFSEWSNFITVTVSSKPQPVLSVSPSWLSPGASVTLSCEVKPPSAGWRFFWYKAVPKPSSSSHNYELLPGSSNGTQQNSYIVHGQKHTAGYVCRAGRGEPKYYTDYSEPKFVWSEVSIKPSVILKPDWPQIFRGETVTLSCQIQGGRGTRWTYEWRPTNRNPPTSKEYRIQPADDASYSCRATRDYQLTGWSDVFRLKTAQTLQGKLTLLFIFLPEQELSLRHPRSRAGPAGPTPKQGPKKQGPTLKKCRWKPAQRKPSRVEPGPLELVEKGHMFLGWPGNSLVFPRRSWPKWLRRGKSEHPCLGCDSG